MFLSLSLRRIHSQLITYFYGDNAETSTLVSLDIDRRKWSQLVFRQLVTDSATTFPQSTYEGKTRWRRPTSIPSTESIGARSCYWLNWYDLFAIILQLRYFNSQNHFKGSVLHAGEDPGHTGREGSHGWPPYSKWLLKTFNITSRSLKQFIDKSDYAFYFYLLWPFRYFSP